MWPGPTDDSIDKLEAEVNILRERVESARLDLSEAEHELAAARERLAIAKRFEEGAPV